MIRVTHYYLSEKYKRCWSNKNCVKGMLILIFFPIFDENI